MTALRQMRMTFLRVGLWGERLGEYGLLSDELPMSWRSRRSV
jgi:hypothetical protein